MYMAYGWPQVIPLESPSCPSTHQIVYLKVVNHVLLVVALTHLELWSSSQHRVRLGKYKRDVDSIRREGENLQAIWSPDTKLIAVLTTSFYLHIFKVRFTEKNIQIGGKQPTGLSFAKISLLLSAQVPFANDSLTVSNFICDNKHMLIGLSDGSLYNISWKGEFCGAFFLDQWQIDKIGANKYFYQLSIGVASGTNKCVDGSNHVNDNQYQTSAVVYLEFSIKLGLLFVLYSDGELIQCSVSKKGLKFTESIIVERRLASRDDVCTSVASEQRILAVGTQKGAVELYDLADYGALIRSVSLYDWGYSAEDTGAVNFIAWTPDNSAFAVGWKLRGLTVWSVSCCRLMSTIRQIGLRSVSSPVGKPNQDFKYEPMMRGTLQMHWDEYGYRLYAVEEGSSERIISFTFGKCCLNRGVSGATYVRQVIYGEDRLLIVQSEETDELKFLHVNLPVSYISQNWPVLHVAASRDGMYLAVAGLHGLVLYDIRLKHWRLFGDVTQEQQIQCRGLIWLGKIVVVCNYVESSNTYELLFYPRYHLDQSSLLCRKPLLAKPMVMDVYQDYLLVTYQPFDVHIYNAKITGDLSPSSAPDVQLSTVRELSMMTAKSHSSSMRFIPDQIQREHILRSDISSSSNFLNREPARCIILRMNGELSLLDLDDGRERELTDSVDLFWGTCGESEEKPSLIEEVSWLDYGHRGMQVWYSSPDDDPFKQEEFSPVIAKLEGPAVSQYCALRLLQATLDDSLYELAGELVRFVLRSGTEYEATNTDSKRGSPRLWGYIHFSSRFKKQPQDSKSSSFKEQSAHVSSVKNILESHASCLMSGKELSKLVAFVKGTQFDLAEYLQRERNGSAQLANFAAGLEMIGQKVLFDLFTHDLRLWKAYSATIQSHEAFTAYYDLLKELEGRLSPLNAGETRVS